MVSFGEIWIDGCNKDKYALKIKNIGEIGGEVEMHPMFIANNLLLSPVPSAKIIMQKYINFLTQIPTTKSVKPLSKLRTLTDPMFDEFDEHITLAWENIQVLLTEPFVFKKFQLNQYIIRKSEIQAINDSQAFLQLQDLHCNFIDVIIKRKGMLKIYLGVFYMMHYLILQFVLRVELLLVTKTNIQLHIFILNVYVVTKPFVLKRLIYLIQVTQVIL